jgi:Ser/Thr protein kinase RdoA (MazF antagonist)
MSTLRIARSFIAADSLAEWIGETYDLPQPISCKLFSKMLRTQDNDHYLVSAGDGTRLVARVYQQGDRLHRLENDYRYELDWLDFLRANGVPVSCAVARRDGSYLGRVDAPEGLRYVALFTFAEGDPPSTDDLDQLYTIGEAMGRIHVLSDSYVPPYPHRPIDLDYLLERPLGRIRTHWNHDQAENLDVIEAAAEEARQELAAFLETVPATPGAWGPIGGDFHLGSVNFGAKGPTFFNFDLCGPGWRAYDIAAFLANSSLIHAPADRSEAFFAGYYAVRPLSAAEHAAISPFLTIRRIWLMGAFAREEGLVGYTFVGEV